jgi:large subunit ribosomal protein L7Ae
VLIFIL